MKRPLQPAPAKVQAKWVMPKKYEPSDEIIEVQVTGGIGKWYEFLIGLKIEVTDYCQISYYPIDYQHDCQKGETKIILKTDCKT
jgi:hypothetical protein